jgi:hypothetical protein
VILREIGFQALTAVPLHLFIRLRLLECIFMAVLNRIEVAQIKSSDRYGSIYRSCSIEFASPQMNFKIRSPFTLLKMVSFSSPGGKEKGPRIGNA